jgi:hypothetical protein
MAYEANIILDLSFDQPAGTSTVTDTSPSGVVGNVVDCEFVPGENGTNCVEFDGQGYVDIEEDIIPVSGNFTILARLKYTPLLDGTKFGFRANLGVIGSNEVWLNIPSDTWGNLAIVKEDLTVRIYWNAELLETITLPAQPLGISFVQNTDVEYGVGNMATVKAYNVAIPIEETPEPEPVYEISVQPTTINFIAEGSEALFTVTATKDGGPVGIEVNKPSWVVVDLNTSKITANANNGYARVGSVLFRPVGGNVTATISITQEAASNPADTGNALEYYLNGVNFKDWDIYVSESTGVLDRPKLKAPPKVDWDDYHGEVVDLRNKRVGAREITLHCFMKATGKVDFATKLSSFLDVFGQDGTQRLTIEIDPKKPLIYEVYNESGVSISKRWRDELMVGTFTLKLQEPDPVKRIVKFTHTATGTTHTITLTSNKVVTVYWGDGTKTDDIYGNQVSVSHTYPANGDYFAVITGVIEDITDFATNGETVWNKL